MTGHNLICHLSYLFLVVKCVTIDEIMKPLNNKKIIFNTKQVDSSLSKNQALIS